MINRELYNYYTTVSYLINYDYINQVCKFITVLYSSTIRAGITHIRYLDLKQ